MPDYRTFLVPRSDYEIVDNWDVSGLEGTGSHVANNLFKFGRSFGGVMMGAEGYASR